MHKPLDKWNWHEMLFPAEKWFEGLGTVLWWKCPIDEPPYAGTPLDSDFTTGYYTHFSLLPNVRGCNVFSARRWLQTIIDALNGADEFLPNDEFEALIRAVQRHIRGLRQ